MDKCGLNQRPELSASSVPVVTEVLSHSNSLKKVNKQTQSHSSTEFTTVFH